MKDEKQGLVFISCGQYQPEEVELGKALAAAVDELTNFQGYFAQNQNSLEGLSSNIFAALDRCSAFVGVMHHRGDVQTLHGKHTRGSVWVEQEIAIAAFLKQAQKRDLQVAVYIQRGLKREGVREQLHLNPVEFNTEQFWEYSYERKCKKSARKVQVAVREVFGTFRRPARLPGAIRRRIPDDGKGCGKSSRKIGFLAQNAPAASGPPQLPGAADFAAVTCGFRRQNPQTCTRTCHLRPLTHFPSSRSL